MYIYQQYIKKIFFLTIGLFKTREIKNLKIPVGIGTHIMYIVESDSTVYFRYFRLQTYFLEKNWFCVI